MFYNLRVIIMLISKIIKKIINIIIAFLLLMFLIIIYKSGKELYLKFKYSKPELYIEDYMAISKYCENIFTICEPSLVCKLEDIGKPMGGLIICRTKVGSTKGLTR